MDVEVQSSQLHRVQRKDALGPLCALAARAFWDDPLFNYLTNGDLLAQYQTLPYVFSTTLTEDRETGGSQIFAYGPPGRPLGLSSWLPPGTFPRPPFSQLRRDLRAALLFLRLRHRRTAAGLLQEVERGHPTVPHWYLSLLATDPMAQGRGIGTVLLDPVLARCDTDGVPAYTETQKPENVAWYGRRGFAVVEEIRYGEAPPVWRLWRAPVDRKGVP